MNERTREALKGSIQKWENIAYNHGGDRGVMNCPLCHEFYNRQCSGCPVRDKVRRTGCMGTPFTRWAEHHAEKHLPSRFSSTVVECETCLNIAKQEIEFLKSLLPDRPREEVKGL